MFYLFILYIYLDAPKETKLIANSMPVKEAENLEMSCSSKAHPKANYTWFKNEDSLPQAGEIFTLNAMTPEDGGMFYCQARNEHGSEKSQGINITVICKYVCVTESIMHCI